MADGGDGFGEVVGHLLGAQRQTSAAVDSAGRPRAAEWWLEPNACIAVVETAQVNGLVLLPAGQYHPFQLDTFGIGAVLRDAKQAGARHVYVGIGGSSTNDGGFGLARSLGWSFWDGSGTELRAWTELDQLARVEAPIQLFAMLSQLERRIKDADLVITAEGAMDAQTLMGKGVGVIAEAAAHAGKPCLCLAGTVSVNPARVPWPDFQTFAIVPRIATSKAP
jgi:glycerate kinase